MSDQSEALKERSMSFAVSMLRLMDTLPRKPAADAIARQLAKCATSVAANYRSVCTARSRPDFVSKLCIVVEEAEESVYWLELMLRVGVAADQRKWRPFGKKPSNSVQSSRDPSGLLVQTVASSQK